MHMMHINELPLRHLFAEIDGPTSSPNAFKGPIGKRLTALPTDFLRRRGICHNGVAQSASAI